MKKILKNQKGFSAVELIIVLVVDTILALVGYVVYKDHHKTIAIGPVTGKWATYTNAAGNFSVLSPAPSSSPDIIPQTTQSHDSVSFTLNGIAFFGSGGQYDVIYLTYPNSSEVPSRSSYLIGLSQPSKYENNVHLVSSKDITVNGDQAETYEITATQENIRTGSGGSFPATKIYETGEFIRHGKVLYEVYAEHGSNSGSDQANAQYFVNSLKIGH